MPAIEAPMTRNEVAELIGVTTKTLMKWVRQRKFPPPLKIGDRRRYWDPESVRKAVSQKATRVR